MMLAIFGGLAGLGLYFLYEIKDELRKTNQAQEKTQREIIGMFKQVMEIVAILEMVFEKEIEVAEKEMKEFRFKI